MLHKVMGDAQVKLTGGDVGAFTFYASTFSNWDRVRPLPERPTKGAFAPHLAEFLRDGFIAVAHDWGSLPIATVTDAREDDAGLLVTAEFHSTPAAQAVRTTIQERLARGKSVKTSIGYDVLADRVVDMDDPALAAAGIPKGRELTDVYLYEISVVNVPANPLADVTAVKALAPARLLPAVKAMMDGPDPLEWEAGMILQCLLSYVREGRMLADADPAALLVTASLLREALDTVGTLIDQAPSTQTAAKRTPPRRVPFDQEGDLVQRAVTLFVDRARNRAAAYARKEGRVLSSANRTKLDEMRPRLRELLTIIDELLAASEPKGAPVDLTPEYYRFLALEARLNGVPIR